MDKSITTTFITTVNHNIGDDFVREGLVCLLKSCFEEINVWNIHKHLPITARKGFDAPVSYGVISTKNKVVRRLWRCASDILDQIPVQPETDKILSSDLLIQSGAPVYWCHHKNHCADNEWYGPLITKRYLKVREKVSFLNLAVGSCQRYHSDGSELIACDRCGSYIKEIYGLAKITTVRDSLSKTILDSLGLKAQLIPCPSIFASDGIGMDAESPEYVCLNYMEGAGHYDFGQNIDKSRWRKVFIEFYDNIKNDHQCVFVCHNQREARDAKKIDPLAEIFIAKDYRDYLKFYARSSCGVVNRVHAAFAMAGFGRPSIVIGSDSRARMSEQIALKSFFVSDVNAQILLQEFKKLSLAARSYVDILGIIKEQARKDYLELFEKV
jgi:hypothetical protein